MCFFYISSPGVRIKCWLLLFLRTAGTLTFVGFIGNVLYPIDMLTKPIYHIDFTCLQPDSHISELQALRQPSQ